MTAPSVSSAAPAVRLGLAEERRACAAQSMVSATPGGLARSRSRSRWTAATTLRASASATPGLADSDDLDLALGRRVADPVVEAAALQRVVQFARAVRGEDHQRRALGLIVPISGMLIWKSDSTSSRKASNSSSARSTSSISSTPGRRLGRLRSSGRSSRNFGPNSLSTAPRRPRPLVRHRADLQHLTGVVPLVERLVGVDALVALQPDQLAPEHRRRSPWRPRSCRRRPRLRAGSVGAGTSPRTSPSPSHGPLDDRLDATFGEFCNGTRIVHRAVSLTTLAAAERRDRSGEEWATPTCGRGSTQCGYPWGSEPSRPRSHRNLVDRFVSAAFALHRVLRRTSSC